MSEKNKLAEKLLYAPKNGYDRLSAEEEKAMNAYCEDYKEFLNHGKTERLCVEYCIELAKKKGFKAYEAGMRLAAGDKVYFNNRGKGIMLAVIGSEDLSHGANIGAAHTDAPRLDLKPRPLYEEAEMAYFKTHHYGGIRKYQWPTIPLALHGVVCREDGTTVTITIGENDEDPVFTITDLLPHLGREQNQKKLPDAITAENLNVVLGSLPIADADAENRIKLSILGLLNEMYGITERDFVTAEIEIVPAFKARDVGLDRSMIGAYGHDDRVDAYPALMAEIEVQHPAHTTVCILTDKEEVGSDGVTGMNSMYAYHFLQQLCAATGVDSIAAFQASKCLSADVTAAYDPSFSEAFEPDNGTYAGRGVAIYKYTGAGGKSSTSDANAELVSYLTRLMNKNGVVWQIGEMGRLDLGGGGTIAKYVANRDIDTIDIGVPVLAMHSPFEVVSKADVYMAYRTFRAFCADAE